MVSSPTLLAELDEVIGRAKFDKILGRSNTSRERSLAEMRQLAEVIVPPPRRYASSSAPFRVGDYFGMMREGHHAWLNEISTNWSKACAE